MEKCTGNGCHGKLNENISMANLMEITVLANVQETVSMADLMEIISMAKQCYLLWTFP